MALPVIWDAHVTSLSGCWRKFEHNRHRKRIAVSIHHFLQCSLQWRHNERGGVSNHQPHDCLLNIYWGADQRKYQSSASLPFLKEIHRRPVNSPHKGTVTRKMFPFDDVIVSISNCWDNKRTFQAKNKEYVKATHYCPCVRGIHRWHGFPTKGRLIKKRVYGIMSSL